MGSGASTEVSGALQNSKVDEIRDAYSSLSDKDRKRVGDAVAAALACKSNDASQEGGGQSANSKVEAFADLNQMIRDGKVDEIRSACDSLSDENRKRVEDGLAAALACKSNDASQEGGGQGETTGDMVRVEHVGTFNFKVDASPEKVAAFLATPASWIKLSDFPEGTPVQQVGSGDDFKLDKPDGSRMWMLEVTSQDGEASGAKVFKYRVVVSQTEDGEEGLKKPLFVARHIFAMTPEGTGCTVQRDTFDFEQHKMLEVPLADMLKNGMIAQENSKLANLCSLAAGGLDSTQTKLKDAFEDIDINNSGYIEVNEFKTVLRNMNVTLSDEDMEQVFKMADLNQDGKLDMPEYTALVNHASKTKSTG